MKFGRDTGLTSNQLLNIWKRVKKYGKYKNYIKCKRCNGRGFLRNNITGKVEECQFCKGWGFYKKD